MDLEDVRELKYPTEPCPHCGGVKFILWLDPRVEGKRAISCDGCGAVISSTHPLDPDDRPKRRF